MIKIYSEDVLAISPFEFKYEDAERELKKKVFQMKHNPKAFILEQVYSRCFWD